MKLEEYRMLIDTEKLYEVLRCSNVEHLYTGLLETCKVKPINCDDCVNTDIYCKECIHAVYNEDHFKHKQKEWYETPDNFPVICWVWGSYEKNKVIKVITKRIRYFEEEIGQCWSYAQPLTKDELMEYCLGEVR